MIISIKDTFKKAEKLQKSNNLKEAIDPYKKYTDVQTDENKNKY